MEYWFIVLTYCWLLLYVMLLMYCYCGIWYNSVPLFRILVLSVICYIVLMWYSLCLMWCYWWWCHCDLLSEWALVMVFMLLCYWYLIFCSLICDIVSFIHYWCDDCDVDIVILLWHWFCMWWWWLWWFSIDINCYYDISWCDHSTLWFSILHVFCSFPLLLISFWHWLLLMYLFILKWYYYIIVLLIPLLFLVLILLLMCHEMLTIVNVYYCYCWYWYGNILLLVMWTCGGLIRMANHVVYVTAIGNDIVDCYVVFIVNICVNTMVDMYIIDLL